MNGQDKGTMNVSLERASGRPIVGFALKLRRYSAIARPDHWIKNVFMLFGTGAAFIINP